MTGPIRSTGRVMRLVVDRRGVRIVLDNDPAVGPKDNLWILPNDHANFSALYSLVLAGAANRWPLVIRIAGDGPINPNQEAEVAHIGVAWDR